MLRYLYTLFIFLLFIICCNEEENIKKELDECTQMLILVEDCMGLHRGALGYIDSCGSLDLDVAKSYNTCDELLDYFGIGELPGNN